MTLDRDDESALPDALRGLSWRRCDIYEAPEWYDVDYAGYRGEEAFYRFLLQRVNGTVVELGAGTGRLALAFASEGVRVHAVEPSTAMRQRLIAKRAKLGDIPITIEDAHGATFAGADRVDAVFFPFNGLLHVRTIDEMLATFSHVRARLAPRGVFALDCTGPYWDAMLYGPTPWGRSDERVHPENGRKVLTCDRAAYVRDERAMHIDIRYVYDGERAGIEVELVQTMWTWQQVLGALGVSGFTIEHLYGDVNLAPFDEGGSRLLVSARPT